VMLFVMQWLRESELKHCRIAMLAIVGAIVSHNVSNMLNELPLILRMHNRTSTSLICICECTVLYHTSLPFLQ
jgi:Chlorophyll A-B binding protein